MAFTINVTLPDWVDERDIFIVAGMEVVAIRRAYQKTINVKKDRCSQCGKCCMDVSKDHFAGVGSDGNCEYLSFDKLSNLYECKIGPYKPFHCCVVDQIIPECTVTYEVK